MTRHSTQLAIALGITLFLVAGCREASDSRDATADVDGRPVVYTVNYPLTYFAERIGGEHAVVVFPAPAGEDPASWNPSADDVVKYQSADLILLNGADYAKWIKKVSLPDSKLVDTTAKARDQLITVENAVAHRHGSGETHSHEGIAYTTWLDMRLASEQARAIHAALVRIDPDQKDSYDRNLASLQTDLENLDRELESALTERIGNRPVVFSHPVFQYLSRRHGLDARAVLWQPDTYPSSTEWAELESLRETHPAKLMIWEAAPLDATVRELAKRGIETIVFNPGAGVPVEGDWLRIMDGNIAAMSELEAEGQ